MELVGIVVIALMVIVAVVCLWVAIIIGQLILGALMLFVVSVPRWLWAIGGIAFLFILVSLYN